MNVEQVCAMDPHKGPLVVTVDAHAQTVCLALRRDDPLVFRLVYATYQRTDQRDAEGRPIYQWTHERNTVI